MPAKAIPPSVAVKASAKAAAQGSAKPKNIKGQKRAIAQNSTIRQAQPIPTEKLDELLDIKQEKEEPRFFAQMSAEKLADEIEYLMIGKRDKYWKRRLACLYAYSFSTYNGDLVKFLEARFAGEIAEKEDNKLQITIKVYDDAKCRSGNTTASDANDK
jgi:hypothetical protein